MGLDRNTQGWTGQVTSTLSNGWVILSTLILGGCDSIFGCDEKVEIQEVSYGIWYEFDLGMLERMRETGWDCRSDGAIRNGAGDEIGQRYRCTKCD